MCEKYSRNMGALMNLIKIRGSFVWQLVRVIAVRNREEFRNHKKKFRPEKFNHNQEVAPLNSIHYCVSHLVCFNFLVRIFSENQTAVDFLKNSKKNSNQSGYHVATLQEFRCTYKNLIRIIRISIRIIRIVKTAREFRWNLKKIMAYCLAIIV